MKFESPHKWLEKQARFINEQLVLPANDIMIALNTVNEAINNYNDDLPLERKIQLIQIIGLNLRNADKSYFNSWNKSLIEGNPFEMVSEIFDGCKDCYSKALAASTLRNKFSPRLAELHIRNNDEVIHSLEKGNIIKTTIFPSLVEYFNILTSIDLITTPALEDIARKQCKKCNR